MNNPQKYLDLDGLKYYHQRTSTDISFIKWLASAKTIHCTNRDYYINSQVNFMRKLNKYTFTNINGAVFNVSNLNLSYVEFGDYFKYNDPHNKLINPRLAYFDIDVDFEYPYIENENDYNSTLYIELIADGDILKWDNTIILNNNSSGLIKATVHDNSLYRVLRIDFLATGHNPHGNLSGNITCNGIAVRNI